MLTVNAYSIVLIRKKRLNIGFTRSTVIINCEEGKFAILLFLGTHAKPSERAF